MYADDTRSRPGEAAVSAAGTAAARGGAAAVAAAEAAVGLLPRSSLSSHLRWSLLLSFLQMTARVCGGGPFPSYRAHSGPREERAHLRPTTHT